MTGRAGRGGFVAGGLLALWALGSTACQSPGPETRGIVVVILDTVRADHLSCYGYERPTSPHLDRLAAEGELYRQAWAQSPWTLPAVATVLTGELPHRHGAGRGEGGYRAVREEVPNLAQRLTGSGYRTAAFFNVVFCSPASGLARGFQRYDFVSSDESNVGHRDAARTTDAALEWLASVREEPFFLVVHYFDPHLTYDPPSPYDRTFDEAPEAERLAPGFGSARQVFDLRAGRIALTAGQRQSLLARYDGEIRFTDEQFGRLRSGLEESGRWRDALVIVIGDHGEEFWDHGGFEHGHSHHRELLRVPLLVKRPGGGRGLVRHERVTQLDVAPTVLDYAGLPVPEKMPGRVLGTAGTALAFAEGSLWAGDLVSVRSDAGTLILDRTDGNASFYAPEDKLEREDLWVRRPSAAGVLETILGDLPAAGEDAPEWRPSPEELERLRALGYVQ